MGDVEVPDGPGPQLRRWVPAPVLPAGISPDALATVLVSTRALFAAATAQDIIEWSSPPCGRWALAGLPGPAARGRGRTVHGDLFGVASSTFYRAAERDAARKRTQRQSAALIR